jgi:hypothetical protein
MAAHIDLHESYLCRHETLEAEDRVCKHSSRHLIEFHAGLVIQLPCSSPQLHL